MPKYQKPALTAGSGFRNTPLTQEQGDALKRKLGFHVPAPKADIDKLHKAAENKEEGE